MSEVTNRPLTTEEIEKLTNQLKPNEELQFLVKYNCTPIEKDKGERYYCKNGHRNFISNYMSLSPNTIIKIKCSECDEIILKYMPHAVRIRELYYHE